MALVDYFVLVVGRALLRLDLVTVPAPGLLSGYTGDSASPTSLSFELNPSTAETRDRLLFVPALEFNEPSVLAVSFEIPWASPDPLGRDAIPDEGSYEIRLCNFSGEALSEKSGYYCALETGAA